MSRPFSEIKREELQTRRDSLIQDYQAASRQFGGYLSEPDRLRINRDIAKIENDIREVENDLRAIAAPIPHAQQGVIDVQVAVIAMNTL